MKYYLAKLGYALVTLWVVITITFILMKLLPGDPFSQEKELPESILQALKQHHGLNDSWPSQYAHYLGSIVTWNLGPSMIYQDRTVNDIIREAFPVSAFLAIEAFLLAIAVGVVLGLISALKENHWQDKGIFILTTLMMSIPSFILATLLQYVLALKCGLCPVARWGTWSHTLLPTLALAAIPSVFIAKLFRTSLLETLAQDYILMAKAKGLPNNLILLKHAARNAFLPILPFLGQLLANILVGSFIIEKIFSIPGLGQWFVISVSNRDYTLIMGLTVFYSAILLSSIFVVDVLYGWLDPRVRLGRGI